MYIKKKVLQEYVLGNPILNEPWSSRQNTVLGVLQTNGTTLRTLPWAPSWDNLVVLREHEFQKLSNKADLGSKHGSGKFYLCYTGQKLRRFLASEECGKESDGGRTGSAKHKGAAALSVPKQPPQSRRENGHSRHSREMERRRMPTLWVYPCPGHLNLP